MILRSALHLLWHTAPCVRVCVRVCSLCPVCESAKTPKRKQEQLRLNRITKRLFFFFFFGGPVQNLQSTQEQKASIFLRLNESLLSVSSKRSTSSHNLLRAKSAVWLRCYLRPWIQESLSSWAERAHTHSHALFFSRRSPLLS